MGADDDVRSGRRWACRRSRCTSRWCGTCRTATRTVAPRWRVVQLLADAEVSRSRAPSLGDSSGRCRSRSVRPSWPLVEDDDADGAAAWAFWIFCTKVQVPRWISAIAPAGKPLKSDAAQPRSAAGRRDHDPAGRNEAGGDIAARSSPSSRTRRLAYVRAVGLVRWKIGGAVSSKRSKMKSWTVTR